MADTLFKYSAIKCGIKYQDKLDFALISSSIPCNCSALFTTNVLKAAPVLLSKDRFNKPVQAIVVNSSNANACTGDQGYANAVKLTSKAAQSLSIKEDAVLNASTGVIGVQLPIEKMISKVDELTAGLSPDKQETFAKAIMTTDTVHKYVRKTFTTADGKEYFIEGFAKGAGMIAPNMATLLSFIMTDAPIAKDKLDVLFREAINISYNAITIDGDMSTNDSAYILSPALPPLVSEDDIAAFSQTLTSLLKELAKMLVEDGEGATKCVTVHVKGCAKKEEAKKIAKTIAESMLVKTAIFGNDPNWGRIACAVGYSGIVFDPLKLSIHMEDAALLINGVPQDLEGTDINTIIKQKEYTITVDIAEGTGEFSFLTSDLSYEYVKINAEYTT